MYICIYGSIQYTYTYIYIYYGVYNMIICIHCMYIYVYMYIYNGFCVYIYTINHMYILHMHIALLYHRQPH